jgi:hypothetical protein
MHLTLRCVILFFFFVVFIPFASCRDIKPENLFWDPSIRRLKLGDFGLTRKMLGPAERRLTPQMVTRWYRSPELLRGDDR